MLLLQDILQQRPNPISRRQRHRLQLTLWWIISTTLATMLAHAITG